jgi:hypothetical protein
MKKVILIMCLISSICLEAQVRQHALGIRLGILQGITYQYRSSSQFSFEGLACFYRYDPMGLVFAQYRVPGFLDNERMSMFFGVGAHFAYVSGHKNTDWYPDYDQQQIRHFISGPDLQVGINYYFKEFPLNLSLDFRPAFNLIGHQGYWHGVALSVRYVF